ncbi:hypothetical protein [Inquilinus sp. Marseille-Q2685]|uniref:hypothetical protein n=1 Tax=Inquilinus sp. Marseille-Q2685 TaxID=2866581 RepID=UPI001CE489D2|nr:hypothetical protein [Inquilinus sp. Marseille-Q2685]
MTLSAEDVAGILGPVDETLVADVIRTGASREELVQAWAWVSSDEAMIGDGRPLPGGRVAALVELLAPEEDEPEPGPPPVTT